jgi:hypothetical protein
MHITSGTREECATAQSERMDRVSLKDATSYVWAQRGLGEPPARCAADRASGPSASLWEQPLRILP